MSGDHRCSQVCYTYSFLGGYLSLNFEITLKLPISCLAADKHFFVKYFPIDIFVNPSNAKAISSKAQGCKDFLKPSKPCH